MELDFYELFASKKDFPMRVAKCYGLYRHRDRPDEAFGLLLEDLSDSHVPLQQVFMLATYCPHMLATYMHAHTHTDTYCTHIPHTTA